MLEVWAALRNQDGKPLRQARRLSVSRAYRSGRTTENTYVFNTDLRAKQPDQGERIDRAHTGEDRRGGGHSE